MCCSTVYIQCIQIFRTSVNTTSGVALNDLRPQKTLDAAPAGHWLECEVQGDRVVHGENRLEVSLNTRADAAGKPIALDCALLYVGAD